MMPQHRGTSKTGAGGSGRTACVIALNDLTRDNRVRKMSRALADAGYGVTSVGIFDYLGAGLAVVVPDVPVMRRIVDTYGCGLVFSEQGDTDLAGTLSVLVGDPRRLNEMRRAAPSACAAYSWSVQADRLISVVERAGARRQGLKTAYTGRKAHRPSVRR